MEQLTGARCDDAALGLNPSRILAPTLWIQVTFLPAFFLQLGTLTTIKQQQCRLLQSGADFSPPPGTKLITFLKRDFQTHLFVSNACFMCLFVCFKTYTATNTPSGLPFPGISSLFKIPPGILFEISMHKNYEAATATASSPFSVSPSNLTTLPWRIRTQKYLVSLNT